MSYPSQILKLAAHPGSDFAWKSGPKAYVRAVSVSELDLDVKTPDGVDTVYALHDATGARLALAEDRETAFALAAENEIMVASAH